MSFLSDGNTHSASAGKRTAPICFVGEAPSLVDLREGRPFAGPSGSILTTLMHNIGMARTDCYMTYVVKEVPKGNNLDAYLKFPMRGAPIESPAFKQYQEELKRELTDVRSNVIVAVGNLALWALCRKVSVTKWRGSILESTLLPGRKVIPIIHPSSAMRQYLYRHYISFDLQRIKVESQTPEISLPRRDLVIGPDFLTVTTYLNTILQQRPMTGVDIEVMNEELSCIAFAPTPDSALCIPFYDAGRDYWTLPQEAEIWRLIADILYDENIVKVFQNGIFDMTFMFRKFGAVTRNYEDTMIAQAVAYPDFPKGLDFITSIYTREPYYKDEGKKHFKFGGAIEDFWTYNAKDAAVTREAFPKIMEDLARMENIPTYRATIDIIEPLMFISEHGIPIDVEGRARASKECEEKEALLLAELQEVAGRPLNPNSPKQLCDYFYLHKRVKPYINRNSGAPTVDGKALKRLARKGFREAQIIQEIRKYSKLRSTYLEMNIDKDNRCRASYNPVGTVSLRFSSSKNIFDTGGNMQNQPIEMKQFELTDPGYIPYQLDLSQAENRIVAYISPEPNMKEAFENGTDIHSLTASLIFGQPIDLISDEPGSCEIGGGEQSQRFWGKKANHGLNYDLGYKTFAFYYEISEQEAKFICDRYHQAYPGVRRMHSWIRNAIYTSGKLTNIHGWNRYFLGQPGDELFKNAYSFIPQSDVPQIINRRGVRYVYETFAEVILYNQVHDSIWIGIPQELPWSRHAEILLAIKHSLEQPLEWHGVSFSIPADIEMGLRNFGKFSAEKNPAGLKKVKTKPGISVEELASLLESIHSSFGG